MNDEGNEVDLFELINQDRLSQGLRATSRVDLRFSVNTGGEIYITNKRDGVIRRLVAVVPETGSPGILCLVTGSLLIRRRRNV